MSAPDDKNPVNLNLGESMTYRLEKAILIYTGPAATVHEVDDDGVIKPGQPISRHAIESLAQSLGKHLDGGWLPPNVVSLGFGAMAWFCPAGRRRIWFKADGRFNGGAKTEDADTPRVQKLNGKFAWHPPLLFTVQGSNLSVFALARNERPQAGTTLYRAPYWNLWESGAMCAGNRAMPEQPVPSKIPDYEKAFFESAFTHTNISRLCRYPGGHTALWQHLTTVRTKPDHRFWQRSLVRLKGGVALKLKFKNKSE